MAVLSGGNVAGIHGVLVLTEQRIKSADTGKWYTGIGIWSRAATLNTLIPVTL